MLPKKPSFQKYYQKFILIMTAFIGLLNVIVSKAEDL